MARYGHSGMSLLTPPGLLNTGRWRGLRVGLFGGSFNPAHPGHRHIAKLALAECGLDFVWWLVTPQNPLKQRAGMAPYEERFASVETIIAGHPRMMATHLEAQLGTTYTYDTVKTLLRHYPDTDFTFICGMDNAHIFHRWDRWRELADLIPIVFIARPPAGGLVRNCPASLIAHPNIRFIRSAKMMDISSTAIRNSLKKQ